MCNSEVFHSQKTTKIVPMLFFLFTLHWFAVWKQTLKCLFSPSCVGGKGHAGTDLKLAGKKLEETGEEKLQVWGAWVDLVRASGGSQTQLTRSCGPWRWAHGTFSTNPEERWIDAGFFHLKALWSVYQTAHVQWVPLSSSCCTRCKAGRKLPEGPATLHGLVWIWSQISFFFFFFCMKIEILLLRSLLFFLIYLRIKNMCVYIFM